MVNLSIVVPLYNEEGVVQELYDRLSAVLLGTGKSYEIIFVDDGSKDQTYQIAYNIAKNDPKLKLIKLRSNFGQTAGIAAGIDHSSGEIIITMDGDLQHSPEDIPLFLEKIEEGFDLVSGWRKKRVDNLFLRRIPSKVANLIMRLLSGINIHDFGTTFKAYRRDVIEHVRLYGQFHRFLPVLCNSVMKISITEIPIKNIVRNVGQSNYGLGRTFTVFFDLIRLKFLNSFYQRPLQIFGTVGLVFVGFGSAILGYIGYQRIFEDNTLITLGSSIFLLAALLILTGLQFIFSGLIAELMVKLYFSGHKVKPYIVGDILGDFPNPIYPDKKSL